MTVALELAILEAEAALYTHLADNGALPHRPSRDLTPEEIRAGVRFANLDRIVDDATTAIAREAAAIRNAVLDALADTVANQLDGSLSSWDVVELIADLGDPMSPRALPAAREAITAGRGRIADILGRAARQGAGEAIAEAMRQGLPDDILPTTVEASSLEEFRQAANAHAARVAGHPAERVLTVALEAAQRAAATADATPESVLEEALTAAEEASEAGTEDLARQGANVAHGLGRNAAQVRIPGAKEVYASELLDRNTCRPCSHVDGRVYDSLSSALEDYPGAGGYVGCDGGSRCRGTLVVVWNDEADPTTDDPGDRPPPRVPTDRTPQGPSGVPRPPHIDDDGNVIPRTPPRQVDNAGLFPDVDDTGHAVTVVTDPPTTPPVAAPVPDEDLDPDLADYTDDELAALIEQAADSGDPAAGEYITHVSRQIDLRKASGRSIVDPDRSTDWITAGASNSAAKLAGRPAGRRIDQVRDEFNDYTQRTYLEAELATNGNFVRRTALAEFQRKGYSAAQLFSGPANTAYYYASEDLLRWWADHPRLSFDEYAVQAGIGDRKTRDRARRAADARADAAIRAEENYDPERRAERRRARDVENRRRRRR